MTFTKTEVAAHRVYASIERFLTTKRKLVVDHDKSSIHCAAGLEFAGYEFRGFGGQVRVSEIFRRKRGVSMESCLLAG